MVNEAWIMVTLLPEIPPISFVVIPREERYLEARFGQEYKTYKATIRRWLIAAMRRAFVLSLRYSGLRIRDVVTLSRDRIQDGKFFRYMAKTVTPVWCPLSPFVVGALESLAVSGNYFFWRGESQPRVLSATGSDRRVDCSNWREYQTDTSIASVTRSPSSSC